MRSIDDVAPELAPREQELVDRADELARGIIAERAAAVDRGAETVAANLQALVKAGLAGLTVPNAYGGDGVSPVTELRVLEALAYGDGTTPFVVAQHYGTSRMLAASDNEDLRRAVLPPMASGSLLAGFGISQVRREGRPAVAAERRGDGFQLHGFIPWMTGYGLFSHAVIAGILPEGEAVLAWAPFAESARLRFSAPMELIAMNAAQTVSATCDNLDVESAAIVSVEPAARRARANATTVPCLLGLARANIDDLAALAQRRNAPDSAKAATRLGNRLAMLRPRFYGVAAELAEGGPEAPLAEVRAAATRLALDAAATLIVATGGGANALSHPAQRRLRETSIFATWGLSTEAINTAVTLLAT